jgi:nucleoside 2-deoxyribosyltransferase
MKIYLAGPLFNAGERGFLSEIAARLRALNFEVFVPHEQFVEQKFMRSDGGSTKESAILTK